MSEKKDIYRLEEEKSLEQIADYFEKLASDLRNGHITFDDGTSIKYVFIPFICQILRLLNGFY